MSKLRKFFERITGKDLERLNNVPIPKLTVEEAIKEAHKEYHTQTFTRLYFPDYEL